MGYEPTAEDKATPCFKCGEIYKGTRIMIQCCICASWGHLKCFGLSRTPADTDNYICKTCVEKEEAGEELHKSIEPQVKHPVVEIDSEENDAEDFEDLKRKIIQMESERKRDEEERKRVEEQKDAKLDKLQQSFDMLMDFIKKKPTAQHDPSVQLAETVPTASTAPPVPPTSTASVSPPAPTASTASPDHTELNFPSLPKTPTAPLQNDKVESPGKISQQRSDPKNPGTDTEVPGLSNPTEQPPPKQTPQKQTPQKSNASAKRNPRNQNEKPEESDSDLDLFLTDIECDFNLSNSDEGEQNSKGTKKPEKLVSSSRIQKKAAPRAVGFDPSRKNSLRKLPEFDGENQRVWPQFINAYNYSTKHGPFDDEENTQRLRDFVKGTAYLLIEGFLINPVGAPEAMDVLKQWYGDTIHIKDEMKADLLNMPRPREESKDSFRDFSAKLKTFVKYLEGMEDSELQLNSDETIRQIVGRLPTALQCKWFDAAMISRRKLNLIHLDEYVTRIAISMRNVTYAEDQKHVKRVVSGKKPPHKVFLHEQEEKPKQPSSFDHEKHKDNRNGERKQSDPFCHHCQKVGHKLDDCGDYKKLSLEKRLQLARKRYLCLTCLRKRHSWKQCNKNKGKETPEYHALLKKPDGDNNEGGEHALSHYDSKGGKVLFRIVPIVLHGLVKKINTFAILDDCSSVTLLEQSVAENLGLSPSENSVPLKIQWTQNTVAKFTSNKYTLNISGRSNGAKKYRIKNVYAVPDLNLPQQTIDVAKMKKRFPHLEQAEIDSLIKARPTILIGLEHTKLGTPLEICEGGFLQPIAMKTRLGWTLHGPNPVDLESNDDHRTFLISSELQDLHELVKYNFTTESFGTRASQKYLESQEDARAKKMMEELCVRKGERFEAPLLWKEENVEMPKSFDMAKWRLVSLEKKLEKNHQLKSQYVEKIEDYLKKGYAVKLSADELKVENPRTWYIPHFPVQTLYKPKPRLVFDAAAKVREKSLNSFLLSGPDVYVQLVHVLLNQRLFEIAVIGDIAEMFHQIVIRENDRAAQRFLWRNCDQSKDPEIYQMNRMIFGATSSPFVAQWVKNKNGEDFKKDHPEAYNSILFHHYVDDFIQSFATEEEAIRVSLDVKLVHQKGGFNLRNFVSNSSKVQEALSDESQKVMVNLDKDQSKINSQKVLGLFWDTENDVFIFKNNYLEKLKMDPGKRPTKREFLRFLMSVFDPFGFVANYTVHGKMILQDIWSSKIDWDEQLRDEEFNKFTKWIGELKKMEKFRLARCLSPLIPTADSIQIHVFSDASDAAFSCVIYLRVQKGKEVQVSLLGSKTRVAPTKRTLSIPRLELQGFILGIRWNQHLREGMQEIPVEKIVHWCDSMTVLSWIGAPSRKTNKFVENRVSEALEYFEDCKIGESRYVPSELNVADEATKYAKPVDVSPGSTWIKGPEFLKKSAENWPKNPKVVEIEEESCVTLLHHADLEECRLIEFEKFSKFGKIVRVTSWIIRFVENLKKRRNKEDIVLKPWPTNHEIRKSKLILIKQAQMESFPKEVLSLKEGSEDTNEIPQDSEILRLNPIKHEGILRVGGRIKAATGVAFDTKFPIILSKSHPFTRVLLDEYHRLFAHQHLETCVNEIRRTFWIPDLRVCVKKAKARCQNCKNASVKPVPPQMGNLPAERMAAFQPPFTFTGMDGFGPINITVGRSTQKRWVILYTCLSSRAVHMEVIHSLSTDSCIMAFRNFVCIRRKPRKVFCDNGTNFTGMSNELKKAWNDWKKDLKYINNKVANPVEQYQTEFLFIPPASPHMGGCWERLVRTVKNVLKVITRNVRLKEESFRCFINEAMNIVNSRPLTYLPIEHGLAPALTPNGLLKLDNSGECPPGEFDESDKIGRKQWRVAQSLADHFWRRWTREILPDLTRRTKWFLKTDPLKEGDVVVIVDDAADRNTWTRGRVVKTFPDKTGQVRFADVQTTSGIYRRPTVKLAILDVL